VPSIGVLRTEPEPMQRLVRLTPWWGTAGWCCAMRAAMQPSDAMNKWQMCAYMHLCRVVGLCGAFAREFDSS
jgi:hypothetical protein